MMLPVRILPVTAGEFGTSIEMLEDMLTLSLEVSTEVCSKAAKRLRCCTGMQSVVVQQWEF